MKRSKWKGPFLKTKIFNNKRQILSRNTTITSLFVGETVWCHNGKSLVKLDIEPLMLGHKVGEFAPTRAAFSFKKKRNK